MHIPSHLVNHHYDDRYFDVIDAINEAKQMFFLFTIFENIHEDLEQILA